MKIVNAYISKNDETDILTITCLGASGQDEVTHELIL